ncbi:Protein hedgehog [Seminavis robusta]|uniref:Protein hedgehog n=1 Tax=Seminavis robusta TaxID=568900 RepID=A0A9N8F1H5_9STRA|nr:Protein hedgehog [Seminavis robusta]|eukprot:Sro2631_g333180.1 Protein hedgehog (418) ;mRNA; f:6265-7613
MLFRFRTRSLSALAVLALSGARTAFACSFSANFGSGTSLDNSGTETFNVAPNAVTTCTVSCDSGFVGLVQLYIRYGGSASFLLNDGNDFATIGCGVTVPIVSADEEYDLGWQLVADAPTGYNNLAVSCTCTQAGDGDDRFFGIVEVPDGACFSESAMVQVQDRGDVAMQDLSVGDRILVGNGKYEPVYGFGHRHETTENKFLRIYTKQNGKTPLEMTGDHLVFIEKDGQQRSVRADSLEKGDSLARSGDQEDTVTKISSIKKKGVYMPLTPSGKLVVNGIVASAYVSILEEEAPKITALKTYFGLHSDETIIHWWLSPYRMICMGISSSFCTDNAHNEEGIMNWLLVGRQLALLGEKQIVMVQVMVFAVPLFTVFSIFNLVEFLFGAGLAPTMLALTAGLVWFMHRAKNSNMKKKLA